MSNAVELVQVMRRSEPCGRVLITGGAGFIGSNLARNLSEEGLEVVCVDNLSTGRRENLSDLIEAGKVRFLEMDITEPEFLETAGVWEYDEIYHLACPTGVPNINVLSEEMLMTCSMGTMNTIRIACQSKASMVLTSSCEVYGDPEVFPQVESYTGNVDPRGDRSPYEEGKRVAEAFMMMARRRYGANTKIVRIFNTYGPGMSVYDQRIIPSFMRAALSGEPLTVFGDGSQTRTYLYIDDNVEALKNVCRNGDAGEAYNLGSEKEVPVYDLAEQVVSLMNSPQGIQCRPHFISDHQRRRPNTDALSGLGWRPQVPLDDGLRRTAEYFRDQMGIPAESAHDEAMHSKLKTA